jgi:hypothetical protein
MGHSATVVNLSNAAGNPGQELTEKVCLPFLRKARNSDGGWGYRPGTASATEPTAWCLLALGKIDPGSEAIEAGRHWLEGAQNADGSWPTRPATGEGNWVTALAGLALVATNGPEAAIAGAARWVSQSQSDEGGLRVRLRRLLGLGRKKVVEQDLSLRGWSWTPGTSSWVEPTAVALLFLHHLHSELAPAEAVERRRMGEALLYDRMCPAGGWNAGNPKVYGVAGIPQVGPTAWALLALQGYPEREENRRSLDWLAANAESMKGPSSLALAHLALKAGGRPAVSLEAKLALQFQNQGFLNNVTAFAQAAFELRPGPDVLRWAPGT